VEGGGKRLDDGHSVRWLVQKGKMFVPEGVRQFGGVESLKSLEVKMGKRNSTMDQVSLPKMDPKRVVG